MEYACLKGLEPADFFYWFGCIAKIPHGSFQEEKLVAFLADFAEKRGLVYEIDESKNLLMRVPATEGYEDQPPFLFQAHMDMVWRADVPFDFSTQPIELQVIGNQLMAKGTTLGADNAVGMATMLALADGDYPHPELELLFTTAEEVGMEGIRAFDCRKLRSRRMVNMDCGDSHVLCVSSAGSAVAAVEKTYGLQPVPADWQVWKLELSGGLGGHSGIAANKGRACGGNLLGDLLLGTETMLSSAFGQEPIMKAFQAVIATAEDISGLETRFATLKTIYKDTDPGWQLKITAATAETALSVEDSANLVLALSTWRTGQVRADGNLQTVIVTSSQLGRVELQAGQLRLELAVRSACDADRDLLLDRYKALLANMGLQLQVSRRTSGWQENPESKLRRQFSAMHERLFGAPLEIERVHGGVETGILLGKLPDMDAVGIAPTARGAHTTGEYLLLDQVAPYWRLLTAVLAEKI